ncbi:hypothetical protein OH76DRAFT_1420290 [Lentinus brumalis]|uniref:Uncharacterized protein n=1 Tax=Lentinus brumalis TaxID=2498619 RepID=A0A371CZX2_9APHY|nr:hypothetical protein OH76DRAFT_1420551 [Polyporus brumalis]RDX46212.1 hypothetical protein OH76DRAFT_1420290 [Polyporus brumalis]
MSTVRRFVTAIYFDPHGEPRIQRVPVQSFAMGRGVQVPNVGSIFYSAAPTDYLVVRMQRTGKSFVVHFPAEGQAGAGYVANVLVFRAAAAFEGYTNCVLEDLPLARIAAGFAVVTCRNEPPAVRKSDEVLVHEPRSPRGLADVRAALPQVGPVGRSTS